MVSNSQPSDHQAQRPQPAPTATSSARSYVPSLSQLPIPSFGRYLFSASPSPPAPASAAAASASASASAPAAAPSSPTAQSASSSAAAPAAPNAHSTAASSEPNHNHHHHFPHLPHLPHLPLLPHLPTLRRRNSSSNSADRTTSPTPDASTDVQALPELTSLADTALGPVGQPNPTLASRLNNDRLFTILNRSVQDRHRVLVQFLRARQFVPADAMHMLSNALRWRSSVDIDRYLSKSSHNMLLPTACFPMAVISTPNESKHPVVYGLIRLLDKKKAERVPFQNALLSFLESSYFGDTYVLDEMVVILDFRDWSIRRNAPYRLVKDGLQTLQDYYPERLGRIFLVNYPTTIRAAYTVISPIIDAGAKEKIVWIPDADPSATLLKYIPAKSIPNFLGGQLNPRFPSTWPDVSAEFEAANAQSSHSLFHH